MLFIVLGPKLLQPPIEIYPVITLNNSSSGVIIPTMSTSSAANVYVVWDDDSEAIDQFEIFSRSSQNGGNSFSENPIRVSSEGGATGSEPDVASVGSNVYIVWQEYYPNKGDIDIFFARSTNAGIVFESPMNLYEQTDTTASSPRIAAEGSHLFIVWTERNEENGYSSAFFTMSADGGVSFGKPLMLNTPESRTNIALVAASDTNIYAIWDEDVAAQNSEIFLTRSSNGGVSFAKPVNLSNSLSVSRGQQIVVDNNNIYVVWYEENDGIFLAHSSDYGESFDLRRLTPEGTNALDPRIAVSTPMLYVTWSQLDLPNNLVLGSYSKTGHASTVVLGHSSPGTHDVISDSSSAYIVWDDLLDSGKLKIAKVIAQDSVQTGRVTITANVTNPTELSLAVSKGEVYFLWKDVDKVFFTKVDKRKFQ